MIIIVAKALHALVDILSKAAARQRQKLVKITEAQALGFRKIRKATNARNKVRQSFNHNSAADILPDDPYKRD
ncbi:MAG: hypothetical protein COB78_08490 [Hyphomicrobiales bacterium]|nr:MAG: hypothetical protein COB78_08490 [Hyphomicrobiales bacterium]